MKKDYEEKQEELNSEYKDIDEKYRRELINVKVRSLLRVCRDDSTTDALRYRRPRCRIKISKSFKRHSMGEQILMLVERRFSSPLIRPPLVPLYASTDSR